MNTSRTHDAALRLRSRYSGLIASSLPLFSRLICAAITSRAKRVRRESGLQLAADGDEAAVAGFAQERLVPFDGVRGEAEPMIDIGGKPEDSVHRDAYAHAIQLISKLPLWPQSGTVPFGARVSRSSTFPGESASARMPASIVIELGGQQIGIDA